MTEMWYRYEDIRYAPPLDEFDNPVGKSTCGLMLRKYIVKKTTPKGVQLVAESWLDDPKPRFVKEGGKKRFACPTIEEARDSFMARKAAQIRILSAHLRHAEEALVKMQETSDD